MNLTSQSFQSNHSRFSGSSISQTISPACMPGRQIFIGRDRKSHPLPVVWPWLLQWFTWYCRVYLRKHFHSLRVSLSSLPPATPLPLVIYANHASWWDPLIFIVVKEHFFRSRKAFAPIDAAALKHYQFFNKLGFFGVEQGTSRGGAQFLKVAQSVLQYSNHILALTPQGRFADVRERPVRFQAGLGRLARRLENVAFVPLALEPVFWEERLPEILVRFGDVITIASPAENSYTASDLNWHFEQQLVRCQDVLAQEAKARNPDLFISILHGKTGQGGVYDWWRAIKFRCIGECFNRKHGKL